MSESTLQPIEWGSQYEIGINVIDRQHQRIIEYINKLLDMDDSNKQDVALILDSLVDYTFSHFAFEEALMEEAQYEFFNVHQRTHQAFTQRINELHQQFDQGDNVCRDIAQLLQSWLINHIMEDDQSYAPLVRDKLVSIESKDSGNWISNTIKRFFS